MCFIKKYIALAMLVCLAAAGLTSCSSDSDDDESDGLSGTYKGTATIAVMSKSAEFADSSFVITKTGDNKVTLTVPSMSYSATMTFPSYTLSDGTVTEGTDGTYTIAFADFTTEADTNGKTTTVSNVTASVKDGKLTFSATEQYGSMPMAATLTVTDAEKQ